MTDHGSRSYANEKEAARRGAGRFEKKLVELGIRQVLAGAMHPQTDGKLKGARPTRYKGSIHHNYCAAVVIICSNWSTCTGRSTASCTSSKKS